MQAILMLLGLCLLALPIALIVALASHGAKLRRLAETNARLEADLLQLRSRLRVLEKRSEERAVPSTPVEPSATTPWSVGAPEPAEVSPTVSIPEPVPEPPPSQPVFQEPPPAWPLPEAPRPLAGEPPRLPVSPVVPAPRPRPAPKPAFNLEQFMGVKLFAWVGGLALFLGLAFFVKYSFDRDLVPPEVRVALGFLVGIGLVVGGVWLAPRQYKVTAHTLCATGVVSLYGVTFACRSIYSFPFFGPVQTLGVMALITAAAFVLAVRLDAVVVAVLGLLGGFLTPLLLSTGEDNPAGLFGYLALLDMGLLAVVLHRRWNYLVGLAAGATLLMQVGWWANFFERERYFEGDRVLVPMAVFLGFGLLFSAGTWWAQRRRQESPWIAGPTLGLLLAAALVTVFFLSYPALAARPGLVFGYLLLVDLLAMSLVWLRTELRPVLPWAGAVVFGIFAHWLLGLRSDALLPWALAITLVFALLHSLGPILLHRLRPELAASRWIHAFPPVALLLVMVPLARFDPVPWALWPVVFLVDAAALVLAVATASLLSVLGVLVLSLVLVGAWILKVPAGAVGAGDSGAILLVLGLVAVFFAGAGGWLARRFAGGGTSGESWGRMSPEAAAKRVPVFAGGLPFLLLILMTLRLPMARPSPVFGMALALAVLMLAVAWRQGIPVLPMVGLGSVLALEYAWLGFRFAAEVNGWETLAWNLAFAALFGAFPFVVAERFLRTPAPWIAAALAGVLHYHLVHHAVAAVAPNSFMGLVPAAMALPALGQLFLATRRFGEDSPLRLEVLAWMGGAVLFFVTLVFPVQFDRQWLTVAWALEGAALCWLFRRLPHPGLRLVGTGLLLVAFVRLALNPAVLSYHARSEAPFLNWYLYAYGVVAAALFTAARLLAPPRDRVLGSSAPSLFRALGTVLLFLLMNVQIADFFSEPGSPSLTFQFHGNFARDMTYTIAWSLFAFGLLVIGLRCRARPVRLAALGLLSAALLKLFFHDLARLDALYRIVALIVVALVAILASFIYQKSLSHAAPPDDPPPQP